MDDKERIRRYVSDLTAAGYTRTTIGRYKSMAEKLLFVYGAGVTMEQANVLLSEYDSSYRGGAKNFILWLRNGQLPPKRQVNKSPETTETKAVKEAFRKLWDQRVESFQRQTRPATKQYDYIYGRECIYKDSHAAMWRE